MSVHLVTGQGISDHVTSADAGSLNAGIVGTGRYVLNRGNQFAYEVVSNNLIKVKDGDLLNQGRQIRIVNNDYEECTIENGLQSVFRNDLIVIRYSKNTETEIETPSVVIIKGISGDTAVDPSYTTGNILNGDTMDDFPLYRVRLNGLNIEGVDKLFVVNKSMEELQEEIVSANTNLIDKIYPIGSIYLGASSISPSIFIGGTWVKLTNTFLVGAGGSYPVNTMGGEATHTLTTAEMPAHNHNVTVANLPASNVSSGGAHTHSALQRAGYASGSTNGLTSVGHSYDNVGQLYATAEGAHIHTLPAHGHVVSQIAQGGNSAHNNLPPYLAVYMWERTA